MCIWSDMGPRMVRGRLDISWRLRLYSQIQKGTWPEYSTRTYREVFAHKGQRTPMLGIQSPPGVPRCEAGEQVCSRIAFMCRAKLRAAAQPPKSSVTNSSEWANFDLGSLRHSKQCRSIQAGPFTGPILLHRNFRWLW